MQWKRFVLLTAVLVVTGCVSHLPRGVPTYDYTGMDDASREVHKQVESFLIQCYQTRIPLPITPVVRIDSLNVNSSTKTLDIYLNKPLSVLAFREKRIRETYFHLKRHLDKEFRAYHITLYSMEKPIEELIPNLYRTSVPIDTYRLARQTDTDKTPLIRPLSRAWSAPAGLDARHIALWHSHGWYYNHESDRWEWQRPRLFQTVEDLLPLSFVLPYVVPMLENAGATVFLPRERDTQRYEVVVDADSIDSDPENQTLEISRSIASDWQNGNGPGFGYGNRPYPANLNPFDLGSYRQVATDTIASARMEWHPRIPESGDYAVYISYASGDDRAPDAHYTVHHRGGQTRFLINQQIGGRTWIYLGTFPFKQGVHPDSGSVVLTNESEVPGSIITADAVRFGGGMGVIARNGRTSGRPRFTEAARYALQYAGMPDSLVYNLNGDSSDYRDDYQCRGEWVNYLKGAPYGPNADRSAPGLGIPIDLSMAFHTDAGITRNDTTVGTLSIYSVVDADTLYVFPDSVSRWANRDLADIMQTHLVSDIRATFDRSWTRRQLRDAPYSEAYRLNVPAVLVELLSHQNFLDMQYALDPRFRFVASRAMYKAMLKFIAFQNGFSPVIQPLPVTHLCAQFIDSTRVSLSWKPTLDPLEPSAIPEAYVLYTRKEGSGFDNGQIIAKPSCVIDTLTSGVRYDFKVTATNRGGQSFPSSVVSVCHAGTDQKPVLIIDAFDRICAPSMVKTPSFQGFHNIEDNGVPDRLDFGYTGRQYDFNPVSVFRLNDAPGHGASFADFETRVLAGNTFDYATTHGQALKNNGYSFVTMSDESVMDSGFVFDRYAFVDLILGEEKETFLPATSYDSTSASTAYKAFPVEMQQKLSEYFQSGGRLFVSGAYVGTDLFSGKPDDHPDVRFGQDVLKLGWIINHGDRTGRVVVRDSVWSSPHVRFEYNTRFNSDIYRVEAPDALEGVGGASTLMRYEGNRFGAATVYRGDYNIVVLGFPFETILDSRSRDGMMREIARLLLDQ